MIKINKNELIEYEIEEYEDYDIAENDIKEIKKVIPFDKTKIITVCICIFIILICLIIFGIYTTIKNYKLKKLYNEFNVEISNESLGAIDENIIDKELETEKTFDTTFYLGSLPGNLVQVSSNGKNGLITYKDDYLYYTKDNKLYEKSIDKNEENILLEYQNTTFSNLNYSNNMLIFNIDTYNNIGINTNYIGFYDLISGTTKLLQNPANTSINLTCFINSVLSTNKGVYYTIIGKNSIFFFDYKENCSSIVLDATSSWTCAPTILKADEENIYYMDDTGIYLYEIESTDKKTLNSMINNILYKPIILDNNDVVYTYKNVICINENIIYAHDSNIDSINIFNDDILLFISDNKLYKLNLDIFETTFIYESYFDISEIYVIDNHVILNSKNMELIKIE